MATRKKQDHLSRVYRRADAGRVGSSLRSQGYEQDKKGNTYYTVGGVKYNAANGQPVRNQPAAKPQPTSSPRATAVTSGGGRGGSATPPASRPSSGGGTPSKTHTYKDHGSALHVGRYKTLKEHQEAVAKAKGGGSATSTPAPKADIRTARSGTDFGGAGNNFSTPEDKSRYVASNGQPIAGPAYGTGAKASNTASNRKPSDKGMTLAERMRKRRQGLA